MMQWANSERYHRHYLSAGTVLFEEGQSGSTMYLVESGRLQVSKQVIVGADKVLTVLGAGQYVGEMSLLSGAQRSATVKALDDTEVLEIDQEAFRHLLHDQPQVILALMQQLAQRVQDTTEDMLLTALELALAQREPRRLRNELHRLRFLVTGSFAKENMNDVLRLAAEEALNKRPSIVTSLWRPGRSQEALVYLIETDNPQEILELMSPFDELVQWDISLAMDVTEVRKNL